MWTNLKNSKPLDFCTKNTDGIHVDTKISQYRKLVSTSHSS